MPVTRQTLFATPQDAEAAFYEAVERADIDSLMAIWAEDEEITCVTPGGARSAGYAAIREAWQALFAAGQRLHIRIETNTAIVNPFTAIHSLIEKINIEGKSEAVKVATTHVFIRGPLGWRLVLHHASPVPAEAHEPVQVLH